MKSQYLDRLTRSERLESWRPGELADALAVIDDLAAGRQQPGSGPGSSTSSRLSTGAGWGTGWTGEPAAAKTTVSRGKRLCAGRRPPLRQRSSRPDARFSLTRRGAPRLAIPAGAATIRTCGPKLHAARPRTPAASYIASCPGGED